MQHQPAFFRADIEGLRAIAILLVVAGHYALPGFSAGFIGVDVFFVISGYLITSLLWRERSSTGRLALGRFYANRLRRLLPALLTMLVVSSAAIFWLLPLSQHVVQSQTAAMAVVWLSNLFFAFGDINYFAEDTSHNAFLHTWSLGVEEQFYLLWPLLLLLLPLRNDKSLQGLDKAVAAVGLLSLIACLWLAQTQPLQAFYLMPTRAWQFSAGALAWILVSRSPPRPAQARQIGWLALGTLAISLVLIQPETRYPSLWALLPTCAALGLLWAGSSQQRVLPFTLLTSQPMQVLGRLSYAWYLWHWPVLVIGEYLLPIRSHLSHTLLALTLSLCLALITHYAIEQPTRFGRVARLQPLWQMVTALCLMVVCNAQFLHWYVDTYAQQASANNATAHFKADLPVIYRDGCDDYFHSDTLTPCMYGNPDAPHTAVLLGDSIGAQWFPAFIPLLHTPQWKVVVLTKSSCPMVDVPYFLERIGREFTECAIWRNRAIAWLQTQHVDHIFFGGSADRDFSSEQWVGGTRRVVQQLLPHADAIHLIEATPSLPFNGPDCLSTRPSSQCTSPASNAKHVQVAQYLQQAIQGLPQAHWLTTADLVCPSGTCHALREETGQKIAVFRDSQHLTASFAAMAAPHFQKQMKRTSPSSPAPLSTPMPWPAVPQPSPDDSAP